MRRDLLVMLGSLVLLDDQDLLDPKGLKVQLALWELLAKRDPRVLLVVSDLKVLLVNLDPLGLLDLWGLLVPVVMKESKE